MIRIPDSISPELNFRWFVELIVDNSPKFQTASAIAKATGLLGADLDAVGKLVDVPQPGLKLIRDALNDDENPLMLPELAINREGEEPQRLSPRVWARYLTAILSDIDEAAP